MSQRRTLPEQLQENANQAAPDRGFTFTKNRGSERSFHSFQRIAHDASRTGRALLSLGLRPGDRVAMVIPNGEEFIRVFLGALHVGVVPVPMPAPVSLDRLGQYLNVRQSTLRVSGARALVCGPELRRVAGALTTSTLEKVVAPEDLRMEDEAPLFATDPMAPAFLQFTSGSTSVPKGVIVSHGNLAENAHWIQQGLAVTPEDVGCSWLPLHHDMGLIGMVMSPITTASPVVFMDPMGFLKRPADWLRMISDFRGTIAFSPNFAYGLVAARARESELEGVNLETWRVAGCGAEPIDIDTLRKFGERFAPLGFRSSSFLPCFGMAESTLAVSFHELTEEPIVDCVHREGLAEKNRAIASEPGDPDGVNIVSCGKPFPGHDLRIARPDGSVADEQEVGEIVLRGPSVTSGYFNNEAATKDTIRDGWLHTGDRGYLSAGNLFVCGRSKEMLIIAGRNYFPTDIEWACFEVEGVRKGSVVAFNSASLGQADRLVLVVESRLPDTAHEKIALSVKSRVRELIGISVVEVVVLSPGSVPKTSSGKLQRTKVREMYQQDGLTRSVRPDSRLALALRLVGASLRLTRFELLSRVRARLRTATQPGPPRSHEDSQRGFDGDSVRT